MPAPLRPSFWEELRRRRVVRAVAVYGVVVWVVVQVADVFFPALRMPDWTVTLVAVLSLLGFPVTVALAWLFDRTPDGVRRAPDPDPSGARGEAASAGRAASSGAAERAASRTPSADDSEAARPAGGTAAAPAARSALDRRFAAALGLGVVLGVAVVGAGLWVAGGLRGVGGPAMESSAVVAVLPFETIGDADPIFTEGIHGDVLTRLSGVAGVDVIARGSVIGYRDPERPAGEIARELGAGWILRGEVQQVGDRVQVNARLVDARRDRQVWAEAFRRELTAVNLFDIQREITHRIASALESRLMPEQPGEPRRATTDDLAAYQLYVQGRGLLGPREEGSMRRAREFFRRAIERDSSYAAAWAGLADALNYLQTFGYPLPPDAMDAERAARRALELEPGLAEAHFALANLAHARRDNPAALRRAERAIEQRPSYSDAYNLLSWIQKQGGDVSAALESARRAVQLDPLGSAPLSNLSLAHLAAGDPEAAADAAERVQELHPGFTTGTFLRALALYHQGRFTEAEPFLDDLEVAWAPGAPSATLALTRLALGDTAAARAALAEIDPGRSPFSVALVRAALGEAEAGFASIAELESWPYWPTFAVRYFFPDVLDALRADPRYPTVLRRVERSWGWRSEDPQPT